MVQYLPYNPQADPQQYLAQGLQNFGQANTAELQRRQFSKGLSPTLSPIQLMQLALQTGLPIPQALKMAKLAPTTQQGFTLGIGQTRFGPSGQQIAKGPAKLTKRQELRAQGYNPEEVRRIMDIEHGLEPRRYSRITYDKMTLPEKMKYLSTERTRAEGQYYGTPEQKEVRQPKYLKWILKEQKKVEKTLGGEGLTPLSEKKPREMLIDKVTGKPKRAYDQAGKPIGLLMDDGSISWTNRPELTPSSETPPGVLTGAISPPLDYELPTGQDPTPQNQAEYDAIPQGTWFMDTDGKRKRKR